MYIDGFHDPADVFRQFDVSAEDRVGLTILLAIYEIDGYEGSAIVVYKEDDKYYTVDGSHCSCMGLEDQWSPIEVNAESLELRHYGFSDAQNEAYEDVIKALLAKG